MNVVIHARVYEDEALPSDEDMALCMAPTLGDETAEVMLQVSADRVRYMRNLADTCTGKECAPAVYIPNADAIDTRVVYGTYPGLRRYHDAIAKGFEHTAAYTMLAHRHPYTHAPRDCLWMHQCLAIAEIQLEHMQAVTWQYEAPRAISTIPLPSLAICSFRTQVMPPQREFLHLIEIRVSITKAVARSTAVCSSVGIGKVGKRHACAVHLHAGGHLTVTSSRTTALQLFSNHMRRTASEVAQRVGVDQHSLRRVTKFRAGIMAKRHASAKAMARVGIPIPLVTAIITLAEQAL